MHVLVVKQFKLFHILIEGCCIVVLIVNIIFAKVMILIDNYCIETVLI